jgi:hypothetical protein
LSSAIAAKDLTSYYQARVAQLLIKPVIDIIIRRDDPELFGDVSRIAKELVRPVHDVSIYSEGGFVPAEQIKRIYEIEQREYAARHDLFDGIIQQYIDKPTVMRRLMEHVARLGQTIKVAAPHAHDNVMEDLRPARDALVADYQAKRGALPNFSTGIPESIEYYITEMIRHGYVTNQTGLREALAVPIVCFHFASNTLSNARLYQYPFHVCLMYAQSN